MSANRRVVVVGGANIDLQARCRSPFRAGDSNPGSLAIASGGVGRNIAENLARLGSKVELISVLGDDVFSAKLEASCSSVGVGLDGCVRLESSPASQYLCILDSDGSLAAAVAAMDSMDLLVPERLEERASLLDSAYLVIVDANVPEASIGWLARRYPKGSSGPLLGFDPVSAKKAARGCAFLASFAFAKPNRAEAAVLAGLSTKEAGTELPGTELPGTELPGTELLGTELLEPEEPGTELLSGLLRARGLGEAFISLGPDGLWAEGPGIPGAGPERWRAGLPSRPSAGAPASSASASGAGDAACAAIAWGLLEGLGLGERCSLALAAAIIASASETPVNPDMSAALLAATAKGIERERLP